MKKIKILVILALIPLLGTAGFGLTRDGAHEAPFAGTYAEGLRDSWGYRTAGGLLTINIGGDFITLPLVNLRGYADGILLGIGVANDAIVSRGVADGAIVSREIVNEQILLTGYANGTLLEMMDFEKPE